MNDSNASPRYTSGISKNKAEGLPPWMTADPISMGEKFEIWSYKVITYMPVLVTFGVFGFLFTYYSYVSLNLLY